MYQSGSWNKPTKEEEFVVCSLRVVCHEFNYVTLKARKFTRNVLNLTLFLYNISLVAMLFNY